MMKSWFKNNVLYIGLIQALVGSLGSLYFSEILKLPPCLLCWYQRIFMYPLVFIITIGILKKDKNLPVYALPLSIFGAIISLYQNLLYYNIIPERLAPCTLGVSCTQRQISLFGFLDIPNLALLAFMVITGCLIIYQFTLNKGLTAEVFPVANQKQPKRMNK